MNTIKLIIVTLIFMTVSITSSANVVEVEELTGEKRTACEAILCLSDLQEARKTPECHPPLNYFYSIKAKRWKNTLKKRKNFLKLCPGADDGKVEHIVNQREVLDCDDPRRTNRADKKCEIVVMTQPLEDESETSVNVGDDSQNNQKSNAVEDSSGGYWQKKRGGMVVSFTGRYIEWGGDQNLQSGQTYTLVYYTSAGNNQSIRNTAQVTAQNGGLTLFIKNAIIKEGAPILVYLNGQLVDSYRKNGDTGEVIYDHNVDVRNENGGTWAY